MGGGRVHADQAKILGIKGEKRAVVATDIQDEVARSEVHARAQSSDFGSQMLDHALV